MIDTRSVGIRADHLVYQFTRHGQRVVNDVSLVAAPGATVGLLGQSGSGKSTIARLLAGFLNPSVGSISLIDERDENGMNITESPLGSPIRRQVQLVPQDPALSLSPRRTIGSAVSEVLAVSGVARAHPIQTPEDALRLVGLPARFATSFPHELSGGERQRACLARALASRPKVLVADEVTSALDVSIQAGVLNLLKDLTSRLGLTMVFISHDISVVRYLADQIIVLLDGSVVEAGPSEQLLANPTHQFTRALVAAST